MRKSFTRLLSLVMLFGFLAIHSSFAVGGIGQTKVWPIDGTTPAYIKTTDKLMIIYPEAVVASTGSVRLSNPGGLVRVLPATDSRISYAMGDTVVIDFSLDLKELVVYSVFVDAGAFKAADDGELTNEISSWTFTTGDYTAPVLKSVVPKKDAVVDNQTTYVLEMTFEDNAAAAIMMGTGKVSLYKADGNIWDLIDVATQGALIGGNKLVLTSLRPLEDLTNYHVTIDAGVVTDNGLRADGKKNNYAGLSDRTQWVFSTKDFSVPGFASGYPKLSNIGNTSVDVLVKTLEAGKVYAAAFKDGATQPATVADIKNAAIKGNVTLAANAEGTIALTGIGSVAQSEKYWVYVITENNDVAADFAQKWTKDFWTSENTAPKLAVSATTVKYNKGTDLKTTGAADANNVITTALVVAQDIDNIVVEFDEKVKIGAGGVIIRKAADNSVLLTVDASSLSVSNDKFVKIPVSGLGNNSKYYIQMPSTLIMDAYNNAYTGITATSAWAFTTNDVIAPTFAIVPADGASGVKKNAKIVVTFDEIVNVAPNAFTISEDGTDITTTKLKAPVISTNDGKFTTVTIELVTSPSALYYNSSAIVVVKMNDGSIADPGGNPVAIQGQGTVFIVEDYAGPTLTWDPAAGPSKPGDAAKIKFNEPVYLMGGGEITDGNLWSLLIVKEGSASGANVPYTATIADKKTITITPSTPWGSEKTYYIAITSDIEDASGNDYTGTLTDRSKTFTIADVTAATVDLSSVDGKTIATTDPVTLIFKEGSAVEARTSIYYNGTWNAYAAADMAKVIILKENDASGADVAFTTTSSDAATFAINASLAGNKTYYVGVGASTKGADGNVNEPKFVTFNTKFEGTPTVASLSPADNSTEVAKSSNFVITYNTDVEKVTPFVVGSIYFTDGTTTTNVAEGEVTISSKVVTINPGSDLGENKTYDLVVAAGVFKNKNSAAVNTAIALDAWDFATKDTKLDLVSLAPDQVNNVAIDAKLVMTFNEKVSIGTGNVDIKNAATDALIERINIVSSQVGLSNSDKTVTITPTNLFGYNVSYYVEVSQGALVDWVGNKSGAIFGKGSTGLSDWTFTTADPAIVVVKTTPSDGSDKVANDASIVVEFNREIVAGAGEVGYIEAGTTDQVQSYPIGSTNISIDGKKLTITHPNKVFPANTRIYLYLSAGAVKAKTNSAITSPLVDKVTNAISWHTGDVNPPVATVTPKAYSVSNTYEPVETNITIEFDEEIYNAPGGTSITNADVTSGGLFTVNDGTGNKDFAGSIIGKVVTLNPTSDLAENALVTVTVKANKIQDVKGTVIASDKTFTFETVDKTAPVVTLAAVAAGNKELVFSATVTDPNNKEIYLLILPKSDGGNPSIDDVKKGKKISLSGSPASVNNTFTGLMASTAYEIFYVATDSRGNNSAVAKVEGSTFDTVAPLLVKTEPATGAVDVNVTSGGAVEIKLTFNENVTAGSGAITVRDYSTQAQLMVLNETNLTAVSGDSKSLLLTIPGFSSITTAPKKIYVEIAAGAIKDAATAPNNYGGLFGKDALTITTEDNQAPTVDAGGSTSGGIKLDENIKVAFSENVTGGAGTMVLYKVSVTPANAIQVFYAADAVFSGKTATVNPSANLENGVAYIMAVGAGFAKDLSSNGNANVAGSINFSGTTNPAPSATFTPAGGNTAILKDNIASITVTFSENIYLTVNGIAKPLALLTQDELKSKIQYVDGNNAVITVLSVTKLGAASFKLDVDGSKLKHEWTYKVTVSGFEDNTGQVMSPAVANYKTSDGIAPTVTFNPAKDAKDVLVNTPLVLTFSENIYADVISANDSVWALVDNSNVETFVYLYKGTPADLAAPTSNTDFTAKISGRVITITPKKDLETASLYYYGMKKPVEDINSQALVPGANGSYAWFATKDVVAPKPGDINATNYAPLGAGTAANAAMWVLFNEDIVVSTGSVVIRREDGTIFATVSGSALTIDSGNAKKLKINPGKNFEPVTNYFVELQASVVKDKSGNPNVAISDPVKGWLFSTGDTYDLIVTGKIPVGSNTPRNVTIEVDFNKAPVAKTDRYLAVYKADGTAVYQIATTSMVVNGVTAMAPGIALDADQAYYARIESSGFTDASNNKFEGIMDNSWTFSTVNNIAPEVTALSPADNSVGVNPATEFTMTFSRDIEIGSGMIAVRYAADGALFEEVNVNAGLVVDNKLTFNVSKLLDNNKEFYVIVPAGAVTNTEITKDPFAGITNIYTWNFKTGVFECRPIKVAATLVEQMECSALVNINVETEGDNYVLTLNGDTIQEGEIELQSGNYAIVAKNTDDNCQSTASLVVKSVPVTRNAAVETYIDEQVHFVDAESGIDTMLYAGVHSLPYDYELCVRTIIVTVTEEMRTPTIAEIQGQAEESPLVNKVVHILGTVSGVAPGEGFFVQDANAAWSGIWVEFSSATYEGIQIGNGVSVIGEVAEVANVTSIVADSVEFVPPILEVAPVVLANPSELKAEKYESVLVHVEGARASAPAAGTGEWTIYYLESNNALVNDWLYDVTVVKDHYYDVTGIVNARLDNYKLEPRIESDVKDITVLTGINPVSASDFKVYPNPFNDQITIDNNDKLTRVVISNVAGQRVIDIEYPTHEIRTANLVSGIYVISLYTENGIAKTDRMIKR